MKTKKRFLSILLSLALVLGLMPGMGLTAYAAETTVTYDLSVDGKSINKGGVTCTTEFDSYNNNIEGTFKTSNGKFTKIVVNARDVDSIGRNVIDSSSSIEGWSLSDSSSATWTGNSSSVQFGPIRGHGDNVTITFTIEPSVDVTGVSLNKKTSTLTVGDKEMLAATVTPDNATDKTVIWSSDNADVVTVSDGVVTAVAEGIANITVTATNGTDDTSDDKTATCAVTVKKPESTVTKAPTANTLTYNGKPQELVTAGKAEGGTMQYALGTKDAATEEYTTTIPTGTDAGTYHVWYKAVGDSDHADSEPACVDATIKGADPAPVVGTVEVYRTYNPKSGEHFYTASAEERDAIVALGWVDEGVGWVAPETSPTPVFRLYSGTDHHYTTSAEERDKLVALGWVDEGVACYSDDGQGAPLYRLFNPNVDPHAANNNSGSHHFTTNKAECDYLAGLGWVDEGVAWHGVAQ